MFAFYPWTGSHGLLAAKNENDPLYNGVKKLRFLDRRLYYRTFPGINSVSEQQQTQKRHSNTQFTEFSSHAKISENKLPTTFPLLLLMSVKLQVNLQVSLCTVTIECFHMTSRRPYWCPKTMKRRPCWCPKPVPWELNCFLMQTLYFVTMNLHICWPREWKHSVKTWWRLRVVKKSN